VSTNLGRPLGANGLPKYDGSSPQIEGSTRCPSTRCPSVGWKRAGKKATRKKGNNEDLKGVLGK